MMPEEEDVIIDIGSETTQHTAQLDNLFKLTMKKKWDKVVAVYIDNHWARTEMLTKSRETVLHVAVSSHNIVHSDNIKFDHVQKMIDAIPQESLLEILSSVNDEGNTVLHLAAAVGWEEVCIHILEKDFKLIRMQNNRKETPLFVAAHYGNLKAFFCLHETYMNMKCAWEPDYTLCRRNDGMTVLHSAIAGEHFELAYQIMYHYKKLTTYFNEAGESPLHVLAKKPNVFESCSTLGFFDYIIYRCVFVDELKMYKYVKRDKRDTNSIEARAAYPENYRTCARIFDFLWWPIRCSFLQSTPKDEENQQTSQGPQENYTTCIMLFKFGMKIILTVLGLVVPYFHAIQKMEETKQRHANAVSIMNLLIEFEVGYKDTNDGRKPDKQNAFFPWHRPDDFPMSRPDEIEDSSNQLQPRQSIYRSQQSIENRQTSPSEPVADNKTPLLIAATMGILEMVEKILVRFPVAIQDVDSDGKNAFLLAAENRHFTVFQRLLNLNLPVYLLHKVDNHGNNILHLAAKLGKQHHWGIPNAALEMQWEMKWYKYVKCKIPWQYHTGRNKDGETPGKVLIKTHEDLVVKGREWFMKTAESCSVVATLIVTIAFPTPATVPGGLNQNTGHPIMENRTAFDIYSITSLLTLCLSLTALIFFVAIMNSRCQPADFMYSLPRKFIIGMTALFGSIATMLASFCAGHSFILKNLMKTAAVPIYTIVCVPVALFALSKLPQYLLILSAFSKKEPVMRRYEAFPL